MFYLPSCDALHVTSPLDCGHALRSALRPLCASVGAAEVKHDRQWTFPNRGVLLLGDLAHEGVSTFQLSAAAIECLRDQGAWDDYLGTLAEWSGPEFACRTTRLDIAYDVPVAAAPVVASVLELARAGKVQIGRKALKSTEVTEHRAGAHYDGSVVTGTAYVGSAGRTVRWRVYDKRDERISAGRDDPGDWLRYEVVVRKAVGATLADAQNPTALFWHLAPLFGFGLTVPVGADGKPIVPAWESGAVEFERRPRKVLSPTERFLRAVERSDCLSTLCAQAQGIASGRDPDYGLTLLQVAVQQRFYAVKEAARLREFRTEVPS